MEKKVKISIAILSILFVVVFMISLGWGTYSLSWTEIIEVFRGNGTKIQNTLVYSIRLPRIIIAVFVGIALATAGCILQSVTKNELAEPGILGLNAGAALFVVVLIAIGTQGYYSDLGKLSLFLMPFVAIIGAFVAAIVIYSLSYRRGIAPTRLILVGIGVNAGINAVITLYQLTMGSGDYNRALTWISGSLWGSSWKFFWVIAPITILFFSFTLWKSKCLDVMELGDELATGLGVQVEKERRRFLCYGVVLAAAATAVAGNIAFLALLGSQIARRLVGPIHRRKIPVAALISAIIIIIADAVSRNLFSPIEIPVGITISIVGVPYFVYLMLKEK